MADRDPNEIVNPGVLLEKPEDFEGIQLPPNVAIGTGNGQYYAHKVTYADGHTAIKWYKRGSGDGTSDPVEMTTPGPPAKSVKDKWDQGEQATANNPRQSPQPIPSSGQQVQKAADGHIYQYNPQTGLYDIPRTDLETGAATAPRVEGTPLPGGGFDNSQPIMVSRDANGKQIGPARALTAAERTQWEKDTGQQQSASEAKPLEGYPGWTVRTTKTGDNTKTEFVNPQGQVAPDPRPSASSASDSKPLDGYPGWTVKTTKAGNETKTVFVNPQGQEAQDPRPSANTASDSKPLEGHPGWTVKTVKSGNDTKTVFLNPQGQEAPDPRPASSPYTQVSQDPDTKKWYGLNKSGQWVEMQGGPGSAAPSTTPGPPLPTIIVGHSQDALRQYSSDLNAAVSAGMTPAERDKRWNEALQTATMTINEATLQQRENEANLNASTNLANTRMSASTSGFNSALDFVSKLNSTLPEKSNLGGKAFAAILGLQVMQAHKMGAYDNIEPGSQPSVMGRGGDRASPAPPSAPASSPAPATASPDAATIEAQRQQAAAASADVPPAAPPDETPSAPALVSQAPAAPPAAVDPNDQVMIESASGSRMMVPRGMVGEGPGQYSASPSRGGYRVVDAASAPQINPATGEPTGLPAAPINPPAGEPGQNPNAPVGQADPTGGYAVLAQARQPSPAEVTPMPVEPSAVALQQYPTAPPAPSANDMPPALLHTQARINPVWRLDEQTVQRMRAAGVPDEVIFGVPGAAA